MHCRSPENGEWIRIYPVPLSFLTDLKGSGKLKEKLKYTWFEIDLKERTDDFRPESHSPMNYDFEDIAIGETINTNGNWAVRKDYCLNKVNTNKTQLLDDSKAPGNLSIATFKPSKYRGWKLKKMNENGKNCVARKICLNP